MTATSTLNAPSRAIAPLRMANTAISRRSCGDRAQARSELSSEPLGRAGGRRSRPRATATPVPAAVPPASAEREERVRRRTPRPGRRCPRARRRGAARSARRAPRRVPEAAFAMASSSGVWATSGSSAAWAGRIERDARRGDCGHQRRRRSAGRTPALRPSPPWTPPGSRTRRPAPGARPSVAEHRCRRRHDDRGRNTTPATTPASTGPPCE